MSLISNAMLINRQAQNVTKNGLLSTAIGLGGLGYNLGLGGFGMVAAPVAGMMGASMVGQFAKSYAQNMYARPIVERTNFMNTAAKFATKISSAKNRNMLFASGALLGTAVFGSVFGQRNNYSQGTNAKRGNRI